jgi:hypothetical protein
MAVLMEVSQADERALDTVDTDIVLSGVRKHFSKYFSLGATAAKRE